MVGEVGNKANTAPVAVGVKVGAELGNRTQPQPQLPLATTQLNRHLLKAD